MAVSEFYTFGLSEMNLKAPVTPQPWQFAVGLFFLGGAKQNLYRQLVGFDVFGAASVGRALTAGDDLVSAEMLLDVDLVSGVSAKASTIARNSRPTWNYIESTWAAYDALNNWTAGGGDVATPPTAVAFTSPTALGAYTISGLLPFVSDAIALRGGRVLLRLKMDDEADNGIDRVWAATDFQTDPLRPRLRVTYTTANPLDIDHPDAHTHGQAAPAAPVLTTPASAPPASARPARPSKPTRTPHGR